MINYEVTPADIEDYREKGYWISPKLIDDDRVRELRDAVDRLFKGERDGHGWYCKLEKIAIPDDPLALRSVSHAWWVNDAIYRAVTDAGLGKIAARLMGVGGARLWANLAMIKPGTDGESTSHSGNVRWHQDGAYWHVSSNFDNMVTAWIALQDTNLPNGAMRGLAGSHRWGLIEQNLTLSEKNRASGEKDLDSHREALQEFVKGEWIDEPFVLRAGEVSFHHSFCSHASGPNTTREPRMCVTGHYMPADTTFRSSGKFSGYLHLLGPRPEPGMPLREPAFPLVWAE